MTSVPFTVRVPYWITQDDRRELAETICWLFGAVTVHPTTRTDLDAVLTELGVAEARDQVWPLKAHLVRKVQGYTDNVLPIRMSERERRAVLSIPILPDSLRSALTNRDED